MLTYKGHFLGTCALAAVLFATSGTAEASVSADSLLLGAPPPEPRGALTLGEVLALARLHHPSLRGAAWRVRAAQARRTDASRLRNPTVILQVENFGGSLDDQHRETTVLGEQSVELGGKRGARGAAADALIALGNAELSDEERRVLDATAERFFDAWILQQHVHRLTRAERLAERTIDAAEERFRAGAGPAVERVRAEALHALRQNERQRAIAELEAANQRLAGQWGATAASFDSLLLEAPVRAHIPPADSLLARLESHPARRRAAAEVAVEDARLREARAARAPDLSLQGGVRRLEEAEATGFVVGLSLPLPLWNSQSVGLEAAAAERSAATAREAVVSLQLQEQLRTARQRYLSAVATEEALRTRVQPKHEEALRQIASGYQGGRSSSLELLEAQRSLLETELATIDARAEAWRTRLWLERLIGAPLEQVGAHEEGAR